MTNAKTASSSAPSRKLPQAPLCEPMVGLSKRLGCTKITRNFGIKSVEHHPLCPPMAGYRRLAPRFALPPGSASFLRPIAKAFAAVRKFQLATSLIDGATTDIGYRVARQLAHKGLRVFRAARADGGHHAANTLQDGLSPDRRQATTAPVNRVPLKIITKASQGLHSHTVRWHACRATRGGVSHATEQGRTHDRRRSCCVLGARIGEAVVEAVAGALPILPL